MTTATAPDSSSTGEFGYLIRLGESFEEMLGKTDTADPLSVQQFGEVVARTACILLQARGGAGKSHTASRLAAWFEQAGMRTAWIPAVTLFDRTTTEPISASRLARTAEAEHTDNETEQDLGLVVIDGLNEVDRSRGDEILRAVGPFAAAHPHLSVLITDRLARRDTASPYWRYATLTPVPLDKVQEITGLDDPPEALSIPFYLERHIARQGATEILAASLTRYVHSSTIPALARAAYDSYESHSKRNIDTASVTRAAGRETWDSLVEGGGVVRVGSDYHFNHHLLHDYLAGYHLASHRELWNRQGFGVVTLSASSFDALALAVSLVADPDGVNDIVQRVYDWNYYAAAYMVEEDRNGSRLLGRALETAILGALAEKRFDSFRATAERVSDALRVQTTSMAKELLDARDRDQIVKIIVSNGPEDPPPWYRSWIEYFSRPSGSAASRGDVDAITTGEPLVGWCVANMLRRLELPDRGKALRAILAKHPSPTVRWRTVHALGAHPSSDNFAAIRTALVEDADEWVRYGALRAEFEQIQLAARNQRQYLVSRLTSEAGPMIASAGPLRNEAIRCLDVDPMPEHWHADIEPMLLYLWETADARGASALAALAEDLRRRKEEPVASRG